MRKILKYPFEITDTWAEQVHVGGKIIYAGMDIFYGKPCLWIEVDTDAPKETRRFRIYGTGNAMYEDGTDRHIGSFQRGEYFWHVYEVILEPV